MIPPILISVRVSWLWIPMPVVLLWPLFALVWIFLGLVLTIAHLSVNRGGNAPAIGQIWIESWRLLCALRGTEVEVEVERSERYRGSDFGSYVRVWIC